MSEQQIVLYDTGMSKVHNVPDAEMVRADDRITDVTGKSECVEDKIMNLWIKRIGLLEGYQNRTIIRKLVTLLRFLSSDLILLM